MPESNTLIKMRQVECSTCNRKYTIKDIACPNCHEVNIEHKNYQKEFRDYKKKR